MKFKLSFPILAFVLVFMSSCTSWRKSQKDDLNYMQNIEQVALNAAAANGKNNTIQPGDQLVIFVTAKDPKVAVPFNQNFSTSDIVQPTTANSNTPTSGQVSFSGPTYIVDPEGLISFPYLGAVSTSGKTMVQLRDELVEKISRYIISPSVNIRLANFRVTVLGEVNRQGDYVIPNGQGNILNALGLAGDLTMYGRRDNILVVRNTDGVISKELVNIKDANFINSPYYNLKQGDVIYVAANQTKEKTARLDPNTPIFISVAGIVVTILALIFRK